MKAKFRYEVGLEKLDHAAGQISVMQQELSSLKPQLVQAAQQVQEIMQRVEKESADVAEV